MTNEELYPLYEGVTSDGDVIVSFYPQAREKGTDETSYRPIHVVPMNDPDNPHVASEDCFCIPRLAMEETEKAVYWVYRHGWAKERTQPLGIGSNG
ncbi:hypothetical protein SEA_BRUTONGASTER_6 [Gordonia phage BrutonGaster]|uniref:Uncharacterized protein n=1 Tax=Gordonia phage BrutonGaster TaxID=2530116 RepID=A0A482JGZ7_9CAUD|nr:hypothetical protein HOV26_gp006 [Gordonia phage BrutonGaster]QBP33228.1 hypothetical protein SEA_BRUTONGASTER_6 [Gordonia phage BrutonGaster]